MSRQRDEEGLDGRLPEVSAAGSHDDARLEVDLHAAFRPLRVPSGFAERVLARAGSLQDFAPLQVVPDTGLTNKRRVLPFPRVQWIANSAVAAALLAGCLAGDVAYQRHRTEQRRAAEATAQFEAAERVTYHALGVAREQVERAGVRLAD